MIPRNDSTSITSFRGWLHYMLNIIATQLEHYRPTNNSGGTLPAGSIVYASGDNEMDLAFPDAMNPELSWWIGVLEIDTPNEKRGTIKNAGYVRVFFKDDELLAANPGAIVYVSNVAGKGTIDEIMSNLGVVIGYLADASDYDGDSASPTYNPYAYVYLRSTCSPR